MKNYNMKIYIFLSYYAVNLSLLHTGPNFQRNTPFLLFYFFFSNPYFPTFLLLVQDAWEEAKRHTHLHLLDYHSFYSLITVTIVTKYWFNNKVKFSSNIYISDCVKNNFQGPGLFPITITKQDTYNFFSFFLEKVEGVFVCFIY